MTAQEPLFLAVLGTVTSPGTGEAARTARQAMVVYGRHHSVRLEVVELSGDARADRAAYARLESVARLNTIGAVLTWGRFNHETVQRIAELGGAELVRLDQDAYAEPFPFRYYSLTPEERRASTWARSVDSHERRRRTSVGARPDAPGNPQKVTS